MDIDIWATPTRTATMIELCEREDRGNESDDQRDAQALVDGHYRERYFFNAFSQKSLRSLFVPSRFAV